MAETWSSSGKVQMVANMEMETYGNPSQKLFPFLPEKHRKTTVKHVFFFSQSVKVISQHFFLSFFPICFSIFHHFPVRGASSCCSSCGRPAWRLASSSAAAHWSPAVEPQSGSRVWRSWSWWVARKNGGMMMWNDGYINPCITRILYRYISNQVMSSYSMYTLYIYIYICIHTYIHTITLHYITLPYIRTYIHTYIHISSN